MQGDVTVIGGGWSVRDIDLRNLLGIVIAVNDSAIYAPRWDYAVSMDRLWTENRIDQLERIFAAEPSPQEFWVRKSAIQNLPAATDMPWVKPFDCDHKTNYFTGGKAKLNGTNSGACAINLAWKLKAQRVFLLGFDMSRDEQGRAYWYPSYPWSTQAGSTSLGKYSVWSKEFSMSAVQFKRTGCQVFNVSPHSAIEVFKKITAQEYARECR